ncbi:MAG: 4Fe-4S dicluster domain-containing protein [Ruminococcus sp.]|nr:4Fe-4S dicluster domain-containing protein [Ruminococcus sp.]
MFMITINFERCKGCGLCTDICPKKIIVLSKEKHNRKGYYPAECTDNSKCISCALCAMMCPDCAIRVERGE